MIRLQRVTFLALHDYLGLTTELTRSNDDTSQVRTTHRTHNNHRRRRSHTHSNLIPHSATTSMNTFNKSKDDLIDNEKFRSSRSISTTSCTSPSSDQNQTTPTATPDITNNKNQFENLEPSLITERTVSIPVAAQKRTTNFAGQRSMSVVEGRHMKPDFEEAAARARVKNSLDTTFFEKHKISYPNVSNNRLSNSSATRRRSSFSDVNLRFFKNFVFIVFS
jgi:hypothetical protein